MPSSLPHRYSQLCTARCGSGSIVSIMLTVKSSSSRLSSSAASPHGGAGRRPGYQRENSSGGHGSKRGRRRLAAWASIDRPGVRILAREDLVVDL